MSDKKCSPFLNKVLHAPTGEETNSKSAKQILEEIIKNIHHLSNFEVLIGLQEVVYMLIEADELASYLEEIEGGSNATTSKLRDLLT